MLETSVRLLRLLSLLQSRPPELRALLRDLAARYAAAANQPVARRFRL